MPFKDHVQQQTGSAVGSLKPTVAIRTAVSMRSYNTSLPIVLARVYHLLSPLPPKLKRKRAVSNLRLCIPKHRARPRSISATAAVSDTQGPSPSQVLTTPANIGSQGPFLKGIPDPLRCHPQIHAQKPRKSKSSKRRGSVFTREEKALLEQAMPAITEESDDNRGRKVDNMSIYELEAPSQVSLCSSKIYELEGTSVDSLSGTIYEMDGSSVYELEATTSQDNSSEVSVPSVVVSDFEPIIASNRQLREENQQMSAFLQEVVTKDIITNEQLTRARSECKAAEAALNLLWQLVRKDFEGSERVSTPAEVVQFLSTRELLDMPRQRNSDRRANSIAVEHTLPGGTPLHPAEKRPGGSMCATGDNIRHREAGGTPARRRASK